MTGGFTTRREALMRHRRKWEAARKARTLLAAFLWVGFGLLAGTLPLVHGDGRIYLMILTALTLLGAWEAAKASDIARQMVRACDRYLEETKEEM